MENLILQKKLIRLAKYYCPVSQASEQPQTPKEIINKRIFHMTIVRGDGFNYTKILNNLYQRLDPILKRIDELMSPEATT